MKILIDQNAFYTLAIREKDGEIEDCLAVPQNSVVSNIYWARVENVRGGSCFIKYAPQRLNGVLTTKQKLKVGDFVLCQAVRDEMDGKGAVFKDEIALGGEFIVLCDSFRGVKFSKKISQDKRQSFNDLSIDHEFGFIIRHSALRADKIELQDQIEELINRYKGIRKQAFGTIIKCLFEKPCIDRVLEELNAEENIPIIANIKTQRKEISYHDEILPLLNYYGLYEKFKLLFSRKINLSNGVEIVFDYAEAMTVVDINLSFSFGQDDSEMTKLALEEIVRQIKLRNIGGLIVVDTSINKDLKEIGELTKGLFEGDREKTSVELVENFGLIAINRQKRYNTLISLFYEKCLKCEMGLRKAVHTVCKDIKARIAQMYLQTKAKYILLKASEDIFQKLSKDKTLQDLLRPDFKTKIFLKKDTLAADYIIELIDDAKLLLDAVEI